MTDTELEDRVRTTLRAVADATVVDASATRARRWPVVAALIALVVGAGAVVLTFERDGGRVDVADSTPGPAGVSSPLPEGFDPDTANPVFTTGGSADDVALAYLRARFPNYPQPGVTVEPVVMEGALARARWTTSGETEGVLEGGDLFLRDVDGRWAVVAATTDALDLSDLAYDGERVRGTVRSTSDDSLQVDILDWRSEPAYEGHAPNTFGGSTGAVEVDRRHPLAPAIVRIRHIGGTVLSIAEVRFDPPPLPAHADFERCVAEHTTVEKEPTPDIVNRLCADSLDGEIIGSGGGAWPSWELVATDEPSGRWVTLRSHDQIGVYRLETAGDFDSLFDQLGACCVIGEYVVVAAALRPDASGMQVLVDDIAVAAEGFADPRTGVVYAIALVPNSVVAVDPDARVEVRVGDVFEDAGVEISLAVLGG